VDQGTLDFDPEGQNLAQTASLGSLVEFQPTIPGYSLLERIGEGSFGEVWSATQRSTGQKVAVKLLHRNDLGALSYLEREVSRLAGLGGNPHLLSLIDANLHHVPAFLVTPLLQQSLEQLMGQELTPRRAARYFTEAASGLAYVHSRGILHCDLKPSNLLRDQEGRIRLVDFGQAQLLQQRGVNLGTLWYMPLEQLPLGSRPPQPEAAWDIYALGATFYTLLTGTPPRFTPAADQRIHSLKEAQAQLEAYRDIQRQEPLVPVRQRNPQVDRDLAAIVEHCLHLNADRRYGTVAEILADLERRSRKVPVVARGRPFLYRFRRFLQRNWLVVALALVLSAGLGAALQRQNKALSTVEHLQARIAVQEALRYCRAHSIQGPLRLAEAAARAVPTWELRMLLRAHLQQAWAARKQFKDSANEIWVCPLADRLALVNADQNGTLELFDASSFERVARVVQTQRMGRCSLSGDGMILACPSHDGSLRLLQLRDGKVETAFRHSSALLCAALQRDMKTCLVGDDAGAVLLWDLARGKAIADWKHEAPLNFVVLSADGGKAISAARDGTLQHWQFGPLKQLGQWKHPAAIVGLAYNLQGIWVACDNGRIYRHQVGGPDTILTHGSRLDGIQGLPNGRIFSFGGHQARLWSNEGELLQEFPCPSPILSSRWSEESRRILLGCQDGTVRILNAETGEWALPPLRRPGEVFWVYLREDRQQLYCRSSVVEVWELEGVENNPQVLPVGKGLEEAVWGSTGLGLAVITRQQLQLWDQQGYSRGQPLQLAGRPGRIVIDGDLLRVHFPAQGVIRSYKVNERGQLQPQDESVAVVPGVPLSPSGDWALRFDESTHQLRLASLRSGVRWNVAQDAAAQRLLGGALADDGQCLALVQALPGHNECSISLFRQGQPTRSRTLEHPFWMRFNARGQLLCATPKSLTLYDSSMKELWTFSSAAAASVEASPLYLADADRAGRNVLIGDVHRLLWLDAVSGKMVREIHPVGRLASARLHPEGELVCTLGTQGAHLYRAGEDGGTVPLSETLFYQKAFFHPELPLIGLLSGSHLAVHSYAEVHNQDIPGLADKLRQRLGRRLDGEVEVLVTPAQVPRKP